MWEQIVYVWNPGKPWSGEHEGHDQRNRKMTLAAALWMYWEGQT